VARGTARPVLVLVLVFVLILILVLILVLVLVLILILALLLGVAVVVLDGDRGGAAGRAAAEEAAAEEAAAEAEAAAAGAADDDRHATAAAARHRDRRGRGRREHGRDDRAGGHGLCRGRACDPANRAPDEPSPLRMSGTADMATGPGLRILDDGRPCRRIVRDLDRAAADDCAAARASAEFRQSHSNRHSSIPVSGRSTGEAGRSRSSCRLAVASRCKRSLYTQAR
jgi:hypothetical protein